MKRNLILIWLASCQFLFSQSFGQNKVQYREFDWSYISSPQFDVYYYGDEIELAKFTMETANKAYEQISKHLRWTLRKRVPIIVYHSHNDFQQTNVVYEYMQEGIGGVTELFKNRVVLPFEGDYEQFRHVIHHELVHAVINDMIYGGRMQNIASGRIRLRIPLWANEGLAEFLSMDWDTQADMIIRDLSINERIPSIEELEYYFAYKGGQSVWKFIAGKYGREKIGEIFTAMKQTQNAEKGFKQALGMDFEELTKQWHKHIKKEYWPDIAGRDAVGDIAKALTDHKKRKNYYNVSPAVSPDGSKIAVLSDRSGYMDVYIIDAITGKQLKRLVKGNRSIDFEELKFLQPGISWSPDSRRIVIAAKAGAHDALYLINVRNKKREKIVFDLDGVFTAAWSPDGKQLTFVGNKGSFSDIYIYDLESKSLRKGTDDVFSDSQPSWSLDGKYIAFVSDRGDVLNADSTTATTMLNHDFSQKDIYLLEVATGKITRVTNTPQNEGYPLWVHSRQGLFFVSDYHGIWNIAYRDLETDSTAILTNLLTGAFQLSLTQNDESLFFAGYSGLGWDVYRINKPLELQPVEVSPTQFDLNKDKEPEEIADLRKDRRRKAEPDESADYSNYIFSWDYERFNEATYAEGATEAPPDSEMKQSGEYVPHPYKTHFTLDLVQANLGYNNIFSIAQGLTMFWFSDVMGDHQLSFGTEMVLTLRNSDYYLNYAYLKNRTDYFFTAFHQADFFAAGYLDKGTYYSELTARLRHYGLVVSLSRPFNRFQRLEGGFIFHGIEYKVFDVDPYLNKTFIYQKDSFTSLNPALSYIYDNSVFGYTGPVDGMRQNTTLEISPGTGKKGISYQKLKIDFRKYQLLGRNYTVAGRAFFGVSTGRHPQKYFLGGMENWLFGSGETDGKSDKDARWRNVVLDTENKTLLQDIYFSEFALPLRGARFSERFGTKVFLANFEVRFPFIQYFQLGFPAKIILGNIRGHIFFDVGAAWDDPREFTSHEKLVAKYGTDIPRSFTPWVKTFGYGIKIPLYFLWRIEAAYDVLPNKFSKPQWYVSIGYDW
jgi:Tol biopolymer transport system component